MDEDAAQSLAYQCELEQQHYELLKQEEIEYRYYLKEDIYELI